MEQTVTNAFKALAVVGFAFVAMGQDSCSTESDGGSGKTDFEVARDQFSRATPAELEALVDTLIDDSKPKATCSGSTCEVTYDGGEVLGVLISPQEELFEDQRRVWDIAFRDSDLNALTLVTLAETVSVGGKEATSPVLRVTCDRDADRQINWNNVDVEGIQALCDYTELVNFD